jgi:hypothetical protein
LGERGKRGGRFSYLNSTEESAQPKPAPDEQRGQENMDDSSPWRKAAPDKTGSRYGGEGGRSRGSSAEELASVPKRQGRMKQERSQLNVRILTKLKRQASAKAMHCLYAIAFNYCYGRLSKRRELPQRRLQWVYRCRYHSQDQRLGG